MPGLKVDKREAAERFMEAHAIASDQSAAVPAEWLEKTAQVASSPSATFTPAFGNAILAKATNPQVNPLSLKASSDHRGYSARTLVKDVFVPLCMQHGIDVRTTSPEPLNNSPFFREAVISNELRPHKRSKAALAFLVECLQEVDLQQGRQPLETLASFLRQRIEATAQIKSIQLPDGVRSPIELLDSVQRFVAENVDGGKAGQALVTAILRLAFADVRTRRVNDPSRTWEGDVGVFVEKRLWTSIEVKQKPIYESEVQQFVAKLRRAQVERAIVVAVNQQNQSLDVQKLERDALTESGIHLELVFDTRDLLRQTLRHSPGSSSEALGTLPRLGLEALEAIEASESTRQAWVMLTTVE